MKACVTRLQAEMTYVSFQHGLLSMGIYSFEAACTSKRLIPFSCRNWHKDTLFPPSHIEKAVKEKLKKKLDPSSIHLPSASNCNIVEVCVFTTFTHSPSFICFLGVSQDTFPVNWTWSHHASGRISLSSDDIIFSPSISVAKISVQEGRSLFPRECTLVGKFLFLRATATFSLMPTRTRSSVA